MVAENYDSGPLRRDDCSAPPLLNHPRGQCCCIAVGMLAGKQSSQEVRKHGDSLPFSQHGPAEPLSLPLLDSEKFILKCNVL